MQFCRTWSLCARRRRHRGAEKWQVMLTSARPSRLLVVYASFCASSLGMLFLVCIYFKNFACLADAYLVHVMQGSMDTWHLHRILSVC
jgi:hypothetical protein